MFPTENNEDFSENIQSESDEKIDKADDMEDAPVREVKERDHKKFKYKLIDGEVTITGFKAGSVEELIIPDEILGDPVTGIEKLSFWGIDGLVVKKVYIPSTVKTIEQDAMASFRAYPEAQDDLVEIIVDDDNKWFCSQDGVLFNKEMTELLRYPPEKTGGNYKIPDTVRKISGYAFQGNIYIETLEGLENTTFIGEFSFCGCKSLNITFIPDGVKEIPICAFTSCIINEITIPASVELIGVDAFSKTGLYEVTWSGDNIIEIEKGAFNECNLTTLELPESVMKIGERAFSNNSLTELIIPESVESIGENAFEGNNFTKLLIPGTVKHLGDGAFRQCYYLESVVVEEGVTELLYDVFYSCSSLEEIIIPSTVETVEVSAFRECWSLKEINVAENNSYYSSIEGILFDKKQTEVMLCPKAKTGDVIIPEGVVKIRERAFHECESITKVELPSTVVEIGEYAFYMCISMEELYIPSVTYIDEWAFVHCDSLVEIILPEGIIEIGKKAFAHCDELLTLVIPGSIQKIGMRAFENNEKLVHIEIPAHIDQSDLF